MINKTPLAIIIGALLSVSANAQNMTNTDQTDDTVVVTATRKNTQLTDTAASVIVIDEEDIEENMVEHIEDLFKYTPGINVQSNSRQGVQSINIRGIEGNRIKVLVDGVSQTNQYDSGALFINSSRVTVDTDMIKAVEVVKGAASSLQGSDAIGGIVAFETKDAADILQGRDFGGYAKLNYSSADNTFSESFAVAKKSGDLESLVAYTRRDGEEVDNFGNPGDQDSNANNLLVKLQYQFNTAHRFEFSGNVIRNKNNLNELDYSSLGYTDAYGSDETEQYQLGIKHIWNSDLRFADQITWSLDWLSKEETSITNRTYSSTGNVQKKDYFYSDKGFQFDGQFDKSFEIANANHYLIYGASFSHKNIENTNNEYNSVGGNVLYFYVPEASETRFGLFAQDEISVGDFIITPGVRFDSYETDPGDSSESLNDASEYKQYSDSAITGRLGTVYKLNQQHNLFAQVSQGFRAPDFKELYYSWSQATPYGAYYNKPNPQLKAEESISYEAGWRFNVNSMSNEISLFYSDYDNFIDSEQISGSYLTKDLVNQYINIDKATIRGVEWSNKLTWDSFMPFGGFSSRIAAAYTEGEDGNGNPLNSVSPWNAVAGVSYDSANQWGSTLNVSYTAKKKATDIDGNYRPIDAATVVDITAYYKPIEELTLRIGVFNVTDEEYYHWNDVRELTSEDHDLSQPHRNFSVTAKYEF